ncbi:MAG: LysR family transcriptional regulator [Eubacteriaceae bacterium]|jgi:DNA-binding transcriptional LysR family regulator
MEIRVLRYFLTVVREENITRAANVLHITQPTLSRQIAQLEEELGVTLFNRGTRKITLTDEGILLRRRAEEILALVDKTEKEMAEQEDLIDGEISIGCGEMESVKLLPRLMKSFNLQYPLVTWSVYTATADQIRERMDQGLTDIGLLLEPIDIEKYDFIRMDVPEHWVALLLPDDPLAEKDTVTAEDLIGKPFILPERLEVRHELAGWFGPYYEKLNLLCTSNLSTNTAVMVEQGLGYALTLEGALPFLDSKQLVSKRLSPEWNGTSVLA